MIKTNKVIFNDEEEEYIVNSFINNQKSIKELLREFGICNRNIIIRVLEKYNVDYKNSRNQYGRKYFFDEHYFESINTKEKAYWLGFMYADGYITKQKQIGCGLKSEDKYHLESFLKTINISQNPLTYSQKTNSYRFTLTSEIMFDNLITLGFSTDKSHDNTSKIFEMVPYNFKKAFILGLWDGDGNFSISKTSRNLASIISNNESLLCSISLYINQYLGVGFSKVKRRTNGDPYPRIRLQNNKAKLFGDWIYSDAPECYLQRKYNIYLEMKVGTKAHIGFKNYITKGILCIENNKIYETALQCVIEEFGLNNAGACNGVRQCCRGEKPHYRGKHFRYLTDEERKMYKCQV